MLPIPLKNGSGGRGDETRRPRARNKRLDGEGGTHLVERFIIIVDGT